MIEKRAFELLHIYLHAEPIYRERLAYDWLLPEIIMLARWALVAGVVVGVLVAGIPRLRMGRYSRGQPRRIADRGFFEYCKAK